MLFSLPWKRGQWTDQFSGVEVRCLCGGGSPHHQTKQAVSSTQDSFQASNVDPLRFHTSYAQNIASPKLEFVFTDRKCDDGVLYVGVFKTIIYNKCQYCRANPLLDRIFVSLLGSQTRKVPTVLILSSLSHPDPRAQVSLRVTVRSG